MSNQVDQSQKHSSSEAVSSPLNAQKRSEVTDRGRELIDAERRRQVEIEGWDAGHDDEHELGEMARAAYCYEEHVTDDRPLDWPWGKEGWKPKDRLSNLVRAGALYQAEIDRLTRRIEGVADQINAMLNAPADKGDSRT